MAVIQQKFHNPLQSAVVFVAHACSDHKASNFLADEVEKRFRIWYSCDRSRATGNIRVGSPVFNRKKIASADYVLFLASEASMASSSIAHAELSVAQILDIKTKTSDLGIVTLDGFSVPTEFRDLRFESFSWTTRKRDAERITLAIGDALADRSGFVSANKNVLQIATIASASLEQRMEYLSASDQNGAFLFNAITRSAEMAKLVEALKALPKKQKHHSIQRLLDLYLSCDKPQDAVARQNAAFILGKVAEGDLHVARQVKKRFPDFDQPFLFRGVQISLAHLGDVDTLRDYVQNLASEPGAAWDAQRRINRDFHLFYYEGLAGVLNELRTTLRDGRPRQLLALNVVTLSEFSKSKSDLDLLNSNTAYLTHHGGVSRELMNLAIRRIKRRIP